MMRPYTNTMANRLPVHMTLSTPTPKKKTYCRQTTLSHSIAVNQNFPKVGIISRAVRRLGTKENARPVQT